MPDTLPVAAPALPAIAPNLNIPTNLCVVPDWTQGGAQKVSWSAVPGCTYNLYASDVIALKGLTVPTGVVPVLLLWGGSMFSVTSVNAAGVESMPSNRIGITDGPPSTSSVPAASVPSAPTNLLVVPEWNAGTARNALAWDTPGWLQGQLIKRDGVEIARGVWASQYFDMDVLPGQVYSYEVFGMLQVCTPMAFSLGSGAVAATALSAPPAALQTLPGVNHIQAKHSSAFVFIDPALGAVDHRLRDTVSGRCKYAGPLPLYHSVWVNPARQPLSIEWTGIEPGGVDLVLEAVDKLGPFQRMMDMECGCAKVDNGQGDASNIPIVLSASAPFHVDAIPRVASGKEAFVETWDVVDPLVLQPLPSVIPPGSQFYGQKNDYAAYANKNWTMKLFGCDNDSTKLEMSHRHFMPDVYDGGGAKSSYAAHNNNASFAMQPNKTVQVLPGQVLCMTMESTMHNSSRRWWEFGIGQAGAELINIGKFAESKLSPTTAGAYLRWQIQGGSSNLDLFPATGGVFSQIDLMQPENWADGESTARISYDHEGPLANGTAQDLDKKHVLRLYVSADRYRFVEETPSGLYNILRDKTFPAGVTIDLSNVQPYWVYQLYHTGLALEEQRQYAPWDRDAINNNPFNSREHVGIMTIEVLDGFPGDPVIVPPIIPPVIPPVVPPVDPPQPPVVLPPPVAAAPTKAEAVAALDTLTAYLKLMISGAA
jgi:hypothetical protein